MLGSEIQLIVLGEEQRTARQLATDRQSTLSDRGIDDAITVEPGLVDALVDNRLDRDVPQVVVREPEQRVADDRVMEVVRSWVGGREEDRECLVGVGVRAERSARSRELPLDLGSRSGHPGGFGGVRQRGQRFDQTPSPRHQLATGPGFHRGPIAENDRRELTQEPRRVAADRLQRRRWLR